MALRHMMSWRLKPIDPLNGRQRFREPPRQELWRRNLLFSLD